MHWDLDNGTEDSRSHFFFKYIYIFTPLQLRCQATFSYVILTVSDVDGNVQSMTRQEMWERIEMERMAHRQHFGCGINDLLGKVGNQAFEVNSR